MRIRARGLVVDGDALACSMLREPPSGHGDAVRVVGDGAAVRVQVEPESSGWTSAPSGPRR